MHFHIRRQAQSVLLETRGSWFIMIVLQMGITIRQTFMHMHIQGNDK